LKRKYISDLVELRKNVFLLSFQRDFDFIPGQVIGISINEKIPPRLYSIASDCRSEFVNILFDIKDGGSLTPHMARLKKGHSIFISDPKGSFICKEKEAVFIATGTGIAPFASMIFSDFAFGKTLLQGARTLDSFYFEAAFMKNPDLKYVRCCSQEKAAGIYYGRVSHYLREQEKLNKELKYYLCGSAEMVVDIRDILISKGISFDNIMSEIYF